VDRRETHEHLSMIEAEDSGTGIVGIADIRLPLTGKFLGQKSEHRLARCRFEAEVSSRGYRRQGKSEIDEQIVENLARECPRAP
jgi:hypothetical protein